LPSSESSKQSGQADAHAPQPIHKLLSTSTILPPFLLKYYIAKNLLLLYTLFVRVKLSLKAKFLILAFCAFAIGSTSIYFVANRQINSFLLNIERNDFANHVQLHASEYFDLTKPLSLKVGGKYFDYGKRLEQIQGTSQVKILDPNGLVIFSEIETEVGQNFIDYPGVQKALIGEAVLVNTNYAAKTTDAYAPIKSSEGDVRGIVISSISLDHSIGFVNNFILLLGVTIGGISFVITVIAYIVFSNTERAIAEQDRSMEDKSRALTEEQALDEAIMSSIAESLIVINRDGQIMVFNPEAERIIGHKGVDVQYRLYKKIIRLCDKDGKEISNNPITKSLESGEKITVSVKDGYFIKNAKDELTPVSISVAPISGKAETVKGVVATIQDITAEKELNKVKDEFVYIVAHELGNPIFAIDGYLSILKDRGKKYDAQTKRIIDSAQGVNSQLSALVNDLLEVVRSESGQLKFLVSPIDLNAILKPVIESAKIKAKTKGIKVSYDNNKIPKAIGDEAKIREVAINLIDNAIKYTPKGGKVHVSHEVVGNLVNTLVSDNGYGIDKVSLEHMFEKFFRIKTDNTKGISGTGLGLFICKQIVEKCGGAISVASTEGKGSTFTFSLKKAK
jgi:PAS domain S-box-containing protein